MRKARGTQWSVLRGLFFYGSFFSEKLVFKGSDLGIVALCAGVGHREGEDTIFNKVMHDLPKISLVAFHFSILLSFQWMLTL